MNNDGTALCLVKNQTPEICLAAVQQHGEVLRVVENQTGDICVAAVKQSIWAMLYVNENHLAYVENQTGISMKDFEEVLEEKWQEDQEKNSRYEDEERRFEERMGEYSEGLELCR